MPLKKALLSMVPPLTATKLQIGSVIFMASKEIDYIDAVNEELIDQIVGQYVDIYKVSIEKSDENVYGESSSKNYDKGFRVNCLLLYNSPEIQQDEFGPDMVTSIEMYFHRTTLSEGGFYPEIGDLAHWNNMYFEINAVTEPQILGGNPLFNHEIRAMAHKSRLSSLQIEEISDIRR